MKNPAIKEAKIIADRIGADAVVVLAFNGDEVAVVSYGGPRRNAPRRGSGWTG
jgi:hypothetical protein